MRSTHLHLHTSAGLTVIPRASLGANVPSVGFVSLDRAFADPCAGPASPVISKHLLPFVIPPCLLATAVCPLAATVILLFADRSSLSLLPRCSNCRKQRERTVSRVVIVRRFSNTATVAAGLDLIQQRADWTCHVILSYPEDTEDPCAVCL